MHMLGTRSVCSVNKFRFADVKLVNSYFHKSFLSTNAVSMKYKAVIFDIGGVLVPQPQIEILKYEKVLKVPTGFLGKVFMEGEPDNSFSKFERGELLYAEFLEEFDSEVRAAAKRDSVDVSAFSAADLLRRMTPDNITVHKEMFHAIKVLRRNNIKTCALTNNWIDERRATKSPEKTPMENFKIMLRWYFDVVVESSIERIRKPEKKIYELTCDKIQVKPEEAIFLDDIGRNLKPASELGITCLKVTSPIKAVQQLEELTGLKILEDMPTKVVYPPPCKPDNVPHAIATLKSGIKIHYVDVGNGPVVMFFHGFPDSWYTWRHQISAVTSAGYRVIAMDQRGYGDSSVPYEVTEYTQQKLCEDAIDLMDCIGINQATIVGHDWGGSIVWNMSLFYPHRLNGVCSIATPLFTGIGAKRLLEEPETFDYQLYFQKEGVAEKELEEDMGRCFKLFFRGVGDAELEYPGKKIKRDTTNVRERGGFLKGFPKEIPIGKLLTEDILAYYVQQFKKSGFRGPLNWYRNREAMMEWAAQVRKRKVVIPALMMTTSHDIVLKPKYSEGMEDRIPNLSRVLLQDCSHWGQFEKPDDVNDGLIPWLNKIHNTKPKL